MDILQRILAHKHKEVSDALERTPLRDLIKRIENQSAPRPFSKGLKRDIEMRGYAIIAEIKKASPSKGVIRENFFPDQIAGSYEHGGATALSVLTDESFFQGHHDYLALAREATIALPVLRKDFIIDDYQIVQSRALGADCVLLIASVLPPSAIKQFAQSAKKLKMDVLVEVHNRAELDTALHIPDVLIGINNRNLNAFSVSLQTTLDLLPHIPADTLVITESGISQTADMQLMLDNNVRCFLIGEAFMRAEDPGKALLAMVKNLNVPQTAPTTLNTSKATPTQKSSVSKR